MPRPQQQPQQLNRHQPTRQRLQLLLRQPAQQRSLQQRVRLRRLRRQQRRVPDDYLTQRLVPQSFDSIRPPLPVFVNFDLQFEKRTLG